MPEELLGRSGKGFSHVIHASPGIDAPTSLEDSPPLSRPQLLPSGKGMGNPSCCVSSISAGASPGAPTHPRGFPTLLQRPSQENTNRGIISVPLPRTQFLFINGFLYLSTSWKTDGSNRQLELPGPHHAGLGCTTNSSANPSST